ncbi:hypothetical protein HMN09_01099300 [Mycena chlorophos]|uniref:Uncharacterized protein n=2 Tax=Mycena chlorophos TaxID=658473 RepID=A0A146HU61_MYCCL|nr:hypothetical protein HMN09_01099300 [Mycena chlorophos]GAT51317.1 predicted protein [Mycena chlorophos]
MGIFDSYQDDGAAHAEVVNAPHKASISHELLAAAASFEAAKAYEKHVAANGKPDSHATAKELLAAFSGAFVDHMVETKGLDAIDKAKAKKAAAAKHDEVFTEEVFVES